MYEKKNKNLFWDNEYVTSRLATATTTDNNTIITKILQLLSGHGGVCAMVMTVELTYHLLPSHLEHSCAEYVCLRREEKKKW